MKHILFLLAITLNSYSFENEEMAKMKEDSHELKKEDLSTDPKVFTLIEKARKLVSECIEVEEVKEMTNEGTWAHKSLSRDFISRCRLVSVADNGNILIARIDGTRYFFIGFDIDYDYCDFPFEHGIAIYEWVYGPRKNTWKRTGAISAGEYEACFYWDNHLFNLLGSEVTHKTRYKQRFDLL